jgi:hypothetical protein
MTEWDEEVEELRKDSGLDVKSSSRAQPFVLCGKVDQFMKIS